MKYIPTEKLIAEIERRRLSNRYIDTESYENELLEIINSLQQEQPEVDIWKEIHKYFNPHGMELQFDRSKGDTILKPKQLFKFARHFYELGLNARKEE